LILLAKFGDFVCILEKFSCVYLPIQIIKLKCKALSIKGLRGCIFIWATTGQQNPLKQVQVQHKEKKKCCLV
jgi:hypothetical protein